MKNYVSLQGVGADKAAMAVHHQEGETHVVGIANLRVILCESEGFWFAQGVEIDYSAEGRSQKEAQEKFQQGLCATIQLHLEKFGGLGKLLKWTPASEWKDLLGDRMQYMQISQHPVNREAFSIPEMFPYDGIAYLERKAA